ncbi:hypothetical protein BSR28_01415 [Boudabousia liubingyangii]|uniref:hypothetical protein n=1 Tax=Boudabousia liubingyangii TaxID=1921764 RepID=UPI00093B2B9E|nr:hypothetical protein [Boudabousia liubingyangii]OKL48388.1 hypothetical protein BSR28_01415 [Boudabousia liubingyangii]
MKKLLSVLAVSALSVSALTGCSSGPKSDFKACESYLSVFEKAPSKPIRPGDADFFEVMTPLIKDLKKEAKSSLKRAKSEELVKDFEMAVEALSDMSSAMSDEDLDKVDEVQKKYSHEMTDLRRKCEQVVKEHKDSKTDE